MSNTEKALQALVNKTMGVVDAGMFSRQEKHEILRDIRGTLIEMNKVLGHPETDGNPPPDGGECAA